MDILNIIDSLFRSNIKSEILEEILYLYILEWRLLSPFMANRLGNYIAITKPYNLTVESVGLINLIGDAKITLSLGEAYNIARNQTNESLLYCFEVISNLQLIFDLYNYDDFDHYEWLSSNISIFRNLPRITTEIVDFGDVNLSGFREISNIFREARWRKCKKLTFDGENLMLWNVPNLTSVDAGSIKDVSKYQANIQHYIKNGKLNELILRKSLNYVENMENLEHLEIELTEDTVNFSSFNRLKILRVIYKRGSIKNITIPASLKSLTIEIIILGVDMMTDMLFQNLKNQDITFEEYKNINDENREKDLYSEEEEISVAFIDIFRIISGDVRNLESISIIGGMNFILPAVSNISIRSTSNPIAPASIFILGEGLQNLSVEKFSNKSFVFARTRDLIEYKVNSSIPIINDFPRKLLWLEDFFLNRRSSQSNRGYGDLILIRRYYENNLYFPITQFTGRIHELNYLLDILEKVEDRDIVRLTSVDIRDWYASNIEVKPNISKLPYLEELRIEISSINNLSTIRAIILKLLSASVRHVIVKIKGEKRDIILDQINNNYENDNLTFIA